MKPTQSSFLCFVTVVIVFSSFYLTSHVEKSNFCRPLIKNRTYPNLLQIPDILQKDP